MACKHENAETPVGIYQYCPDCGAVRKRRNNDWDKWHTCDKCRLPGS